MQAVSFVRAWFVALLLVGCDQGASLDPLYSDSRILAFGDSLTQGVGVGRDAAYPTVLSSRTGMEVINAGVSGEITDEGLQRLPSLLDQYDPDLVILCHGGNDLLRKMDQKATEANLAAMIELIQQHGADVVLVSVPEPGVFLKSAGYYSELAEQYGIPLEEDIIAELQGDAGMKSDRVHFNEAGYSAMARAIEQLLERHGALP